MAQNRSKDAFFVKALFTDKTFRAQEIRRVLVVALAYALFTTALLGVFYHALIGGLVAGVSPLLFASEDMGQLDSQLPGMAETLGRWLVIMLAVNLAMTAAIGVYIVRRLGEPLLAIKRVLRQVGQGDLTAKLRRGNDEKFGDLFDALTDAVEGIHGRVQAVGHRVDALRETPLSDDASARLGELEQALAAFQTDTPAVGTPAAGTPAAGAPDDSTQG
ncbi:MAG: methyl-accepting chemotaxis protein [Pseudomonadota bacterium]